jgi:hypothetical protein
VGKEQVIMHSIVGIADKTVSLSEEENTKEEHDARKTRWGYGFFSS